jgi:DeoR/GlpR family transcriptional regulator of sugar metabolism
VILAADASKLGRRAVALGLEWEQVSLLVTELDPSDPRLEPYRALTEVA